MALRMKYASFFSGIEGFGLALDAAGFQRVFSCEIDPFCNAIHEARWGHECDSRDITTLKPEEIPDADLWVGGWPCQDLSCAGKRAGIRGERSGLFWSIMKLVKKRKPRFLLLENVPGLLSSNNGQDVLLVLDELNEAGYLVDLDIVDAQFAGVPQRRRRTFFVCERLDAGLKRKSDFSLRGICTAIIDELLFVFRGLTVRFQTWPSDSSANGSDDGHLRREKFFSSFNELNLWPRLLNVFLDTLQRWPHNCAVSGCLSEEDPCSSFGGGGEEASPRGTGSGGIPIQPEGVWLRSSTSSSWKEVLDAASSVRSGSIISTLSQQTIEQRIYTCAGIAAFISERIVASRIFCPRWSEVVSSALTAVKECIAYAGFASECVFASLEWRKKWRDFRIRSEGLLDAVLRLGANGGSPILLEPKGSRRDSQAGREKGKIASGELARSLGGVGGGQDFGANKGTLLASAVSAHNKAEQSYRGDGTDDLVVAENGSDIQVNKNRTGNERTEAEKLIVSHAVSKSSGGGLGGRDGQDDYVIRIGNASADPLVKKPGVTDAIGCGTGHGCGYADQAVASQKVYSIMPEQSGKNYKAREVKVTQPVMATGQNHGDQGGDLVVAAPITSGSHPNSNAPSRRREDDENIVFIHQHDEGANQDHIKTDGKSDALDTAGPGAVVIPTVIDTYNQREIPGSVPTVRPKTGGDNIPAVAFDAHNKPKDKTGTLCGGEKGGGKNEINLPLIAFQSTGGSRDVQAGEKSPPIKVGSGCDIPSPPAVAFTQNSRSEVRELGDKTGCIAAQAGAQQQNYLSFEQRVARNGRGAPSPVVPPLKAESGQTGKGDGAPCVLYDPLTYQGIVDILIEYARITKTGPKEVLLLLQEAASSEEMAQRGFGVVAPFLKKDLLRPPMHGKGAGRKADKGKLRVDDGPLPRQKGQAQGGV